MTPIDPKSPELRRRRFRPIPVRMLVPNVITLLAICAGLTAIRLSTEGRMELAVAAIVFAAVLDGLDGRVARMIKGQSKFGAELDSLADFVNFGVAPGLILYFWQAAGAVGKAPVSRESIRCTDELNLRPSRTPDYKTENRALVALAQALADSPQTILQTLADTILEVFQCDSAGLSRLNDERWRETVLLARNCRSVETPHRRRHATRLPEYSLRSTKVWMVSPKVAIDAEVTTPCSSSALLGSATPRAPRDVAASYAAAASSTRRAKTMLRTPSP